MATRPKTYKNYVPPDEGKAYQISANADGTSKISDVTDYLETGDNWSAADANLIWDAIESLTPAEVLPVEKGGTGGSTAAEARTALGVPPTNHASTATTYGVGTATNYGHVKVTAGNGLAISSGTISMGAAGASAAGAVTTGAQTFAGNKTFSGTVTLSKTTDLAGTANNSPALIVGGAATAAHMEIDANEIQTKTNGTTVAALIINNDGGEIQLGKGGTKSFGHLIMQTSKYIYGTAYTSDTETALANAQALAVSPGTSGSARGTVIVGNTSTKTEVRGASVIATNVAVGTSSVRNIHAGTSAMTAGTTALATGRIYLQYE